MIHPIDSLFKQSLGNQTVENYIKNIEGTRVRLDVVSNPLGAPKKVMSFIHNTSLNDISEYSNPNVSWELKQRIARLNNVNIDQIMVTAGADHAIEAIFTHTLFPKDVLGILIPTFPRFEIVASKLCGASIRFFRDLNKIPKAKIIVLCSPNNPTTDEISKSKLIKTLKDNPDKLFVLDAVFSEFGTWNPSRLIQEFNNLIVIKSMSKSFGIPGARVGFIIANERLIKTIQKGVSPFMVPRVSQIIALQALSDEIHVKNSIKHIKNEFKKIRTVLGNSTIRNSNVPFFLLKVKDSKKVEEKLKKIGISVIREIHFRGLEEDTLRIKIGKSWENSFLIESIDKKMLR